MLKNEERDCADLSLGQTIRKGRKLIISSGLILLALASSRADEPKSDSSNWAFQPPRAAVAPEVKNADWPRSPIDSFILAKLEKAGLNPVADASRATLVRRLYFDLIGLPPTPNQVQAFVDNHAPDAVAKLHFPGIAPELAAWLVLERQVTAVGIDTASIDYGQSTFFETHRTLFEQEIPAFENVSKLDALPATGAMVVALPMKIKDGSGGPLRIVAWVPGAK